MMLSHILIGPLADGRFGVGYQTPGCTSCTIVSAGMTAVRAIEESTRLNEEQEQRAFKLSCIRSACLHPEVDGELPLSEFEQQREIRVVPEFVQDLDSIAIQRDSVELLSRAKHPMQLAGSCK